MHALMSTAYRVLSIELGESAALAKLRCPAIPLCNAPVWLYHYSIKKEINETIHGYS
jgi:hypothetical protein